jgi:hypothetical protein
LNYATWKLNWADPNYGTGPEDRIAELGFGAEGGWAEADIENQGKIMGYVTEPVDETELTPWQVTNITQAEALDFCLAINPEAYLLPDGRITAPLPFDGVTE